MQPWKQAHFIKVLPMSALFTVLLYTSFLTMGHVSIATVVVFRNATPLLTAVGENHIRGEQFSQNSMVSLRLPPLSLLAGKSQHMHLSNERTHSVFN